MTTAQSAHQEPSITSAQPSTLGLIRRGAVAGAIAAVGTTAVAAIARAADVSLEVDATPIPIPAFALWTVVGAALGSPDGQNSLRAPPVPPSCRCRYWVVAYPADCTTGRRRHQGGSRRGPPVGCQHHHSDSQPGAHHSPCQRRNPRPMNADGAITVTPILVAELLVEGEVMPVCVHVIDHPDGRVLVDTGMTELHPAVVAAFDPRLYPLSEQDFDVAGIDIVVNTHLHADHCGGNHLFAGQADLRPAPGARRRPRRGRVHHSRVGRRSRPAVRAGRRRTRPASRRPARPSARPYTRSQVVVVETGGRPVVICGDTAVWFGEFDVPRTEGQRRIRALDPEKVWLAHVHEPWRPGAADAEDHGPAKRETAKWSTNRGSPEASLAPSLTIEHIALKFLRTVCGLERSHPF